MTRRPRKAKTKAPAPPAVPEYTPTRALQLNLVQGDTQAQHARKVARQIAAPETAAYRCISAVEGKGPMGGQIDAVGMLAELRAAQQAVNNGDLSTAEGMLMTQAISLQSLYVRLIERATTQEWLPQFETYMRLGLKAQAQSRLALEALATLRHGPAIMARNAQVNVAHGPQQVNNSGPLAAIPEQPRTALEPPDAVAVPLPNDDAHPADPGGSARHHLSRKSF